MHALLIYINNYILNLKQVAYRGPKSAFNKYGRSQLTVKYNAHHFPMLNLKSIININFLILIKYSAILREAGGWLLSEDCSPEHLNYFWYTQMFKKPQILAIDKTIEKPQNQNSWNNSIVKWFFVHQTPLNAKSYEVCLEMVYLSSKREVKINGVLKHSAMVTFGYESEFEICPGLKGRIKQQGINFNFQFYINGVAFTQLESNKPKYEALSDLSPCYEEQIYKKKQVKKQENQTKFKAQPPKQTISYPKELKKERVQNTLTPVDEEQKIKDTQKELLMILKAQKLQKKL